MSVEKKINNTYHIFKVRLDELNWNYVAEGLTDASGPLSPSNRSEGIQCFTQMLIDGHMEHLKEQGYSPSHPVLTHISFSYKPQYESALENRQIWHTEKLNEEEIKQFEECVIKSHDNFWNRQ